MNFVYSQKRRWYWVFKNIQCRRLFYLVLTTFLITYAEYKNNHYLRHFLPIWMIMKIIPESNIKLKILQQLSNILSIINPFINYGNRTTKILISILIFSNSFLTLLDMSYSYSFSDIHLIHNVHPYENIACSIICFIQFPPEKTLSFLLLNRLTIANHSSIIQHYKCIINIRQFFCPDNHTNFQIF